MQLRGVCLCVMPSVAATRPDKPGSTITRHRYHQLHQSVSFPLPVSCVSLFEAGFSYLSVNRSCICLSLCPSICLSYCLTDALFFFLSIWNCKFGLFYPSLSTSTCQLGYDCRTWFCCVWCVLSGLSSGLSLYLVLSIYFHWSSFIHLDLSL